MVYLCSGGNTCTDNFHMCKEQGHISGAVWRDGYYLPEITASHQTDSKTIKQHLVKKEQKVANHK